MANTISQILQKAPSTQFAPRLNWTKFAVALCGLWLAANTTISDRITMPILITDLLCGAALSILALLSLNPKRDWLRWVIACIGTWLLFAPLLFWAPEALRYDSSTLIGTLVIAFSFLIPGQPGEKNYAGPDVPPGWTYNPSSWQQRGPLILIAFLGFFLARYLAAYQLGYIQTPWDPFFGNGTQKVLDSEISKAFIISDAGLGAFSYLVDGLEGFLGRQNRWRTMPWAVILFAASIVPAGVTSIVLVMLQPIGVGAWCTICLVAAVAMLIMVPFAFDELVATLQFLGRARKRGQSLWHTLMFGGTDEVGEQNAAPEVGERIAASASKHRQSGLAEGFTGVNFPITLLVSTLLGIWVMASPTVLGISGNASDSQHLIGALIVTIAITAMAEPCRAVRLINILAALWLMLSILILTGFPSDLTWTNLVTGIAIIVLSIPKGRIESHYGSYDKFVF